MKTIIKKTIACVWALLLILSALPSVAASASDDIRTVRVGFFAYPGYHEMENDVRSGYGYDFLMLLQRYTSLNYEFIGYENSWEEMQQMLLRGDIDLVTSARKTLEREKLFDFSEPIGTNSAQINVRADDDRFIPGDFSALNGITIGELAGNSRNADVESFAAEKGFSFRTAEFETAEELADALQKKKVDAAASSSLRRNYEEKTVAEFAPEDFYVIVRKGNTVLLEEINYGITQMDVNEGNWRDNLYYQNYHSASANILSFTQREKEYIRAVRSGEKTITAAARPDLDPYSSVENGKLTGIIPDYFAHLMEMAGLPYTALVAEDQEEYRNWTQTYYADVILDCCSGASQPEQPSSGLLTDSYLHITTSRVTQKGFSGTVHSVAAVDSQNISDIEENLDGEVSYVTVATGEEAMKAVRDGKADVCYVFSYMAEKFINSDPTSNLKATVLSSPDFNGYFSIRPETDHELCSILNKCIKADSAGVLDSYVKEYTGIRYERLSLLQYLKLHPYLILAVAAVLAILAVLAVAAIYRTRTAKMKNSQLERELEQQQKLGESLSFTNFFLDTFVSAYYIDLTSQHYQVYKRTEELNEKYPQGENYFTSIQDYIGSDVHPDDRAELLDNVRPERMKEILGQNPEYTHSFRDISGGTEKIYKLQVIRGADENHAAFGFVDITEELSEQRQRLLGAVPLSQDIFRKANIGLWAFELDEGKAPRMYVDDTMLGLIGLNHQVSPEETYHAWYDQIDGNSYGLVSDAVEKMSAGEHAEVQYPWHHPDGHTLIVRCGGIRNPEYKSGTRIEGTHQDVTETLHFQSEGAKRDKDIIEILASEFTAVYYIDLVADTFMSYSMNEKAAAEFSQIFRPGISFSEAYRTYVERRVASEDKAMMLDAGSIRSIMKNLRDKKTFTATYVDFLGRYSEMKLVKVGDEADKPVAVALGLADKDEELRAQQEAETIRQRNIDIIEILASEYSSVYYIDLTTDELDPYTMNEETESEFGQIFRSGIKYSDAFKIYVDTLVYPEDKAQMLKSGSVYNILKELTDKKTFVTTYRSNNNGAPHFCEMKFVKVGEGDNPHAVALGFADKDEEIRAELQRQAISARDAAVISGLSDDFGCVVYVELETGNEIHYRFDPLLSANIPGWESITNFDERIAALGESLVHPDDFAFFRTHEESKKQILDTIEKDGVFYHNFRIIAEGEVKYYQMKIIRDEQSENHVIAGLRNVDDTMRKEMEYQEKLEAANESKTNFLFNMSHDIRTPMNAIIGFTQLAKKHIDDRERTLDSLNKIETSGTHLLELINEVLDMSRVEAGKLHSEMKYVNLSDSAMHLVTICKESADERNISLSYEEKNLMHPDVIADELHINQVIMNILGNAIKYTQPGGSVRYTVEETETDVAGYGKYVCSVEDTGVGMSPAFLEHIFEAFSREDKVTTSEIQGTGLGMAIVKRLVDYMDGQIRIESEQGRGTKVAVTLHLMLADSQAVPAETDGTLPVNLAGRNVLLVEDNELNREIAVDILEEQGIIVDEAVNGIDAVEHIRSRGAYYYDFVLMDIQMPMMDGFEATAEIRKLPGADALPIIALSANAFEEDKKKSIEAGMNDHVSKPIVISELIEAIARLVN